ncbi:MAG: VWA domain-containing protein, partial [Pirellulaceae bacterium]|nr:VWA domain-containing protein [Pirellulaceae bacterium]
MQTRLVHRVSPFRRWTRIAFLGITGICLVLAMMRPQWGLEFQQTPRVGAQIMVCLDVSKSMFAEDTAPNRLERAKAELADLLSFLEGDQIGLTAFAGRATVLCPLTPDFGFFKLILDSAGPHSVGRGGTRLEEPIRKALDGFQSEADVSRAILLITDGEDHDSHPLDAAKAAAERGIKILAIGFGDEAGSEIEYTDPHTGAKNFVLDNEGKRVITHLDGETLREMALATEGAYIPAGTGALDLRSIYAAHIAPLMRGQLDDQGRAIRQESYQWPILVGILFLILAVAIGSGSVHNQLQHSLESFPELTAKTSVILLLSTFFFIGTTAQAQSKGAAATARPPNVANDLPAGQTSTDEPSTDASLSEESTDPRKTFNASLVYLDTDVDQAERLLENARRQAGTDAEVRYRAAYNMGWVEIKRADKVLAEQPQEALQ